MPLRRGRYVLGALLGGGYAAAVFLPGMEFLSRMPVKAAAGVLLALTAFGGERKLLRLTLVFFGVSCAMAGCVLGLGMLSGGAIPAVNGVFYTDVSVPGTAGSCRGGLCGADGGIPCRRPAWGGRGAAADAGVRGRP